jgi:5'-nucleotidase
MKALLTNDDGLGSEGLEAIRRELTAVADTVVTVAPESDCSGIAQACTFKHPVEVTRISGGRHPVYSCDGTPSDCVRVGLLGGLAPDFDVVVCGINRGANIADDVAYSGTVGAGREALILDTSALCLSQQTPTGSFEMNYREDLDELGLRYDFGVAARFGADLAMAMCAASPQSPVLLNVNFPAVLNEPAAVLTRVGRRDYPRRQVVAWGEHETSRSIWLFGHPDDEIPWRDTGEATDIAALRRGLISVTSIPSEWLPGRLTPEEQLFIEELRKQLRPPHRLLEPTLP